jgi:PadR family transcriptional regulator, regulatory protein PadR
MLSTWFIFGIACVASLREVDNFTGLGGQLEWNTQILALQPMNGWAINQRLKQVSGEVLQVTEGSLYPALHKLEQEGWITAEWKQSENNRRAKYYSLTRLGRQQMKKEAANWNRLSAAIFHIVQLEEV